MSMDNNQSNGTGEKDETKDASPDENDKTSNWLPGEKIQRTGTYKCFFCGPDGLCANTLKHAMKSMGIPYTPPACALVKASQLFLKEGELFPSCPTCKNDPSGSDPTGWDFVSADNLSEKSSKACFIATACYGSVDCPEVQSLRCFRDEVLLSCFSGRIFTWLYYLFSPPLARWLSTRPFISGLVRDRLLDPIVKHVSFRKNT